MGDGSIPATLDVVLFLLSKIMQRDGDYGWMEFY